MPKEKMAEEMKVTGCLAQSADMGHFMLNSAMMSDSKMATPKTAPAMKDGMKDDMKPMSYMLTGEGLKAHLGHKVEVTGMMVPDTMAKKTMPKDTTMAKDTMSKDDMATMGTLNVKSVKMLSATCK
ncbi:MAG: hypothetical protein ABIP90_10470 [Vicinamibacterales bacterium]